MKKMFKTLLSFALVLQVMLIPEVVGAIEVLIETAVVEMYNEQIDNEQIDIAYNTIASTLGEAIGMQGFVDDYAIDDLNEIVEIVVQFITPPAIALRLIDEKELDIEIELVDENYEEQALHAHIEFEAQLEGLPVSRARNAVQPEIISEYYQLFNGVYMRVPGYMVAQIASLPEVYAVFPNIRFTRPEVEMTPVQTISRGNPAFMRESLELFEMDYIHHTMGFTGEGVTVAVLDTGIDPTHPEFERFLVEGRIPGRNLFHDNYDITDSCRDSHGTHVSGTVIAMAPNINLRNYPVMVGEESTIGLVIRGVEAAHESSDVMNLSIGYHIVNFHSPITNILNLAALDGTVVVVAVGNDSYDGSPLAIASASLAIAVGASTFDDSMAYFSTFGPVLATDHIKPDIVAPGYNIYSTTVNGYGYLSGTSMAAPHIAGIAALLLEAFPDDSPAEVKARIMNTARPLDNLEYQSVFAAGAGLVQPIKALTNDAIVTVEHEIPWGIISGTKETHTMSSLSFGVIDLENPERNTMLARITNMSDVVRTYTIEERFTNNPGNGLTLTFSQKTLTVGPGETAYFTVTASIEDNSEYDIYEGHLYVKEAGTQVARLPFAASNFSSINAACPPYNELIVEGRFENQPGENGIAGAPWRICQSLLRTGSTLIVDEGFVYLEGRSLTSLNIGIGSFRHIKFTGPITAGESLQSLFGGARELLKIEGLNYFDTSRTTNMSNMFNDTRNLISLDLSSFDTSNVTNMSAMFYRSGDLVALDLSNFDTGNVTNMSNMFSRTSNLASLDLSSFDTSNVTNMSNMFSFTRHLTSLDLSSFDTSNVTNMDYIFNNAVVKELELGEQFIFSGNPSLPIRRPNNFITGYWQNVGSGTREDPQGKYVFTSAQFTAPGSRFADIWVLQPVPVNRPCRPVIETGQFADGAELAGATWRLCEDGTLEVDSGFINWNAPVSQCGSFSAVSPWHEYRNYINRIVFRGEITAGTSLGSLFSNLNHVTEIEGLTFFDTTNVQNMSWMFNQANSLHSINVTSFDTSQVTTMNRMFRGVNSLANLDISHFNTENVTDMGWMFFEAISLSTIDVTSFDTSNVTDMSMMFREAISLEELDVSNFDTSNVIDMREMFRETPISQLDLSSFNTNNVVNMNQMFTGMNYLTELTLGSEFSFIGHPGLPTIKQTETHTGLWQGPNVALTSAQLMAQFDGSTMAGTFVWQEWSCNLNSIIAQGRFAHQAGSTGVTGSEWRLCDDGTLEVDSGFINWTNNLSPWNAYQADITEIVFTGPITAGSSLRGLFRELTEVTTIEGLNYFDTSATRDMHRMFFGASGLTTIDVTSFDTSNVTDMALMFRNAISLEELDVSGFDTSNVVDMREMFRATQIVHLDLTGFDTSSISNMNLMFTGMTELSELTLGSEFSFIGSPGLPGVSQVDYTGRWQNIGSGTIDNPAGEFIFTSTQLMNQFDGSTMADTFVWQPVR